MTDAGTTAVYGLVRHTATDRVLLVPDQAGWSLPGTWLQGRPHLEPGLATRALRQVLGASVVAYRYVRITSDEHEQRHEGIFAVDAPEDPSPRLAGSRWVGRADLPKIPLTPPDHREVIDAYLHECESGATPAFRQPWEQPHWHQAASTWIEETLAAQGRAMLAPPDQVRWWSLSAVMRVQTSHGDAYFKASATQPLFADEAALLTYLAPIRPGQVPGIIASEPEAGWMLLEDIGPTGGGPVSVDRKTAILTAFGGIQRAAVPHIDRLVHMAVRDRRPHTLVDRIAPLLQDDLAVVSSHWRTSMPFASTFRR